MEGSATTYGRGRGGGGRGGFRGGFRGGRGGYRRVLTPEQQLKFWEAIQITCDYFVKKPHKCKKNESFEYFNQYFTETSLMKANKALVKASKMTLDNHSFKVNGIMMPNGNPHTVISFFRAMNTLGFLNATENDTGIIVIKIHEDYQKMISDKNAELQLQIEQSMEPEVIESSSSSEDEDEDETPAEES